MQALNIYKTFLGQGVARHVLDNVTVSVDENDRIGLVGDNGSGKSTLLRILVREDRPNSGRVTYLPDETVGYLPQTLETRGIEVVNTTIFEFVRTALGLDKLETELSQLTKRLADSSGSELKKTLDRYEKALDLFEHLGGYSIESKIREVLYGLGIGAKINDSVSNLSGGQRTRLLLAIVLLKNPSILLLDEPTNHLDSQGTEWFSSFLSRFSGGLVLVSHDTDLLNSVVREIWELDIKSHRVTFYQGNYDSYLEQKRRAEAKVETAYRQQQELITRLQETARRLKQYARSGGQSSLAKRAKAIERRVDRMDKIERPKKPRKISFPLVAIEHIPDLLVDIESVKKSYSGVTVLDNVSAVLRRSDRIALLGPNGSGKTTFARIILGEEKPDVGTVRLGRGIKIGYLPQLRDLLPSHVTVLDEFRGTANMAETEIRRYLSQFLFTGDEVHKAIGALSEGERTRLHIAKLALKGSHLLILDEPTNHLDVESREKLAEELLSWPGALLAISHDQEFLEKIGINRILLLYDGRIREE